MGQSAHCGGTICADQRVSPGGASVLGVSFGVARAFRVALAAVSSVTGEFFDGRHDDESSLQ